VNEVRSGSKIDTPVTEPSSGTVRYELIDKEGEPLLTIFETATKAAEMAKFMWPDHSQDEDRTGKGWDISVAGAE